MADNFDDGVEVVRLRNEFYRDSSRKILGALMICVIVILLLIVGIVYIVSNPPAPKYFATSVDGRIIPIIPLDQPNLSSSAILQWANTAAIAVYTYDFVNYRQALQSASDFFTPDGWKNFWTVLQSSNNLNAVLSDKLIVSAVATGAPVILEEGVMYGVYTWKVQMPMLITYQSASKFSQQNVVVTMMVTRESTLVSPKGIGIAQFIVASS